MRSSGTCNNCGAGQLAIKTEELSKALGWQQHPSVHPQSPVDVDDHTVLHKPFSVDSRQAHQSGSPSVRAANDLGAVCIDVIGVLDSRTHAELADVASCL